MPVCSRAAGARAGAHGRGQVSGVQGGGRQLRAEQGARGEGAGDRLRGAALAAHGPVREAPRAQLLHVRSPRQP